MKSHFILLVSIMLVAAMHCTKHSEENKPPGQPTEKEPVVTTIAGDGTRAFGDGPALSAKFDAPYDVVVSADGVIYVTDANNHRIRKIKDGLVSTFAGSDSIGIVNANGALARFMHPYHMTLDANGNLYTLDVSDPRIRKITPSADVSVYTGIATPGFADGPAGIAQFRMSDGGIDCDAGGNIYGADYNNQRVRKISIAGQVTTIAGNGVSGFSNGNGTAAQFNYPAAIAIDKENNLYVVDGLNFRIRKITQDGQVSTYAGSGMSGSADGRPGVAQFSNINDVVIDNDGNLYVTDDDRIRKISRQGIVSTIAGSTAGYSDGDGTEAKFKDPGGLGIDKRGNLYVADVGNNRIRKISFK